MGRKSSYEANGIVTRKLVSIFSVILLIILSVALFVTPVGAETVNETIGEGDYYSRSGYCKNGWSLRVNVTTDSPVDVFVLSEEDFIGYEVNGDINPPRTGWYSLNTTTFQKNLTISQKGNYFVVVDNTVVPENGAVPTGTVNLSVGFKGNDPAPEWLRVVGVLVLIVFLIIAVIVYFWRFSGQDNVVMWIYFTAILPVMGWIVYFFDIYHFYGGNINSALYLLSAMLQSLAAIITLVVTVTLITVQMASQTSHFQAIRYIRRDNVFLTFLFLYIAMIAVLALLLGDIDKWVQKTNHILYLNIIDLLIVFFIVSIMGLV
ncbi:MAG: hypothetical protein SVJ22_10115, partial [Halobacteriota archaeon]|nr:hypothetical protein [Halobacteriota archaeon]